MPAGGRLHQDHRDLRPPRQTVVSAVWSASLILVAPDSDVPISMVGELARKKTQNSSYIRKWLGANQFNRCFKWVKARLQTPLLELGDKAVWGTGPIVPAGRKCC